MLIREALSGLTLSAASWKNRHAVERVASVPLQGLVVDHAITGRPPRRALPFPRAPPMAVVANGRLFL